MTIVDNAKYVKKAARRNSSAKGKLLYRLRSIELGISYISNGDNKNKRGNDDDVLASFIKLCFGKKKMNISCRLEGIS